MAVRRKGVAGQQVSGVAGLLVVALHRVGQPAVLAGLEIAQAQARVLLEAGAVGQQAAVRREPRAHGAALGLDNGVLGALAQVPARDSPLGKHLVVGEAASLGRVVQVTAIGRVHGTQGVVAQVSGRFFALRRGLGDLHALAAVDVVGPEFVGAQAKTGLRDDDVLAVRRPFRGGEVAALSRAGQLLRFAAVQGQGPERDGAVTVGDEGDALAVRREARLRIVAHALGDGLGGAALDGQQVKVAEDFERQLIPRRGDVQG